MTRLRPGYLLLTISVILLLLGFTLWASWASGPLFALLPLLFTVWFVVNSRKTDTGSIKIQKRISLSVLILAGTVAYLYVVYMSWVSSYNF